MTIGAPRHRLLPSIAIVATLAGFDMVRAQTVDGPDLSIELVDPKVLRVCADPRNMPFSNEKGEGFENKLGELFAEKLQKKLDYMYFPQATGFVRMTLGAPVAKQSFAIRRIAPKQAAIFQLRVFL